MWILILNRFRSHVLRTPIRHMDYSDQTVAGALLFVGAVIFIIGLNVAEQLYPDYSVSLNYISDLGATCRGTTCHIVQPSATIFNSTIFMTGVLLIAGTYFIRRGFRTRFFPALLALSGVGAMGVGIFPEYTGHLHYAAAFIAFAFGGLSAIAAYTIEKPPLRYLSVLLGIVTLTAFVLSISHHDLGLGPGGMERMIAYPFVLWVLGFGGYLMQSCKETPP